MSVLAFCRFTLENCEAIAHTRATEASLTSVVMFASPGLRVGQTSTEDCASFDLHNYVQRALCLVTDKERLAFTFELAQKPLQVSASPHRSIHVNTTS